MRVSEEQIAAAESASRVDESIVRAALAGVSPAWTLVHHDPSGGWFRRGTLQAGFSVARYTDPPNAKILGWWCSGYDHNDVPVICALVGEPEQEAAMAAVLIDWPEAERWRFLVRRPSEWRPGDRFPLSDWMRSRVEDSHA